MVLASFAQLLPSAIVAQVKKNETADPVVITKEVPPPVVKATTQTAGTSIPGAPVAPASSVVVNFRDLSSKEARRPVVAGERTYGAPAPRPLTIDDSARAYPVSPRSFSHRDEASAAGDRTAPNPPSPSPSQSFLAHPDGPKVGTTSFTIPPDTMGAVGVDKIVTYLNNNFVVQDKTTGATVSAVSGDTFWSATGASGTFDPRVQYDPYNGRWLISAVSNALTSSSSVLIAVSHTGDPSGNYTTFRFVVGCASGAAGCNSQGEWADFPMLGFNRNWLAVSWNQFTNTNSFVAGKALMLDYPAARSGNSVGTLFTVPASVDGSFCMHPATTYSATEEKLHFVSHVSSASALYRVFTATGTAASPALAGGDLKTRNVHGQGGWTQPEGDVLPQRCVPGVGSPLHTCPDTTRGIDVGDAFVRSNVVFRNGRLYYAQTAGIGPSGPGSLPLLRTAAQWTVLDASTHEDVDGGRVEDTTATSTNGGSWYAYSSIAANKNGDVLLGFSEFESDDYADAGYAFRLATDAAGTMRDPVIFKEGEDYYEKTFSGSRNRWGDYSHTVIDPSNDRDTWTIQEYAQLRVGVTGNGTNDSRWSTWWAKVSAPAGKGELVISEFRLRGPGGAKDEFIEIYNATDVPLRVTTVDGSNGYAVVASDGAARFHVPAGTVIPARGHFLGINSDGYTLSTYPAGNGTTATGDATYTADVPDNAGLALFRTSDPANFTLANRLDAVGSTAETNALYKEGAGYPAIAPLSIDYSFYRDTCGKRGSTTLAGPCPTGGFPADTDDNAFDFVFVDTSATPTAAGQRLGAPGPENLTSPVQRNGQVSVTLLDPTTSNSMPPNRVRSFSLRPNADFGTLSIRRTVTNNTGRAITRLRFRVMDQTTAPVPAGVADLRALSSEGPMVVNVSGPTAACPGGVCTVEGTTLEEPPVQVDGGAFNSTLSAGTIKLASPLQDGASINLQFLFGIQQTGVFRVYVNVETLP